MTIRPYHHPVTCRCGPGHMISLSAGDPFSISNCPTIPLPLEPFYWGSCFVTPGLIYHRTDEFGSSQWAKKFPCSHLLIFGSLLLGLERILKTKRSPGNAAWKWDILKKKRKDYPCSAILRERKRIVLERGRPRHTGRRPWRKKNVTKGNDLDVVHCLTVPCLLSYQ